MVCKKKAVMPLHSNPGRRIHYNSPLDHRLLFSNSQVLGVESVMRTYYRIVNCQLTFSTLWCNILV